MSRDSVLKEAWGLAEDLLASLEASPAAVERKYLVIQAGDQQIGIPESDIRVVVDTPAVSAWLSGDWLVGVFALRGDICALTDPLLQRTARRLAIVLERPGRHVAVGADAIVGSERLFDGDWKDVSGAALPWVSRMYKGRRRAILLLDPGHYLAAPGLAGGKETSP